MKKYVFIAISILIAASLFYGCSDRGTNVTEKSYSIRNGFEGTFTIGGGHVFPKQLAFSMFNALRVSPKLDFRVYFPPGYAQDQFNRPPLPALYLIGPFNARTTYYLDRALVEVVDELLATGQIEPMYIVLIDASSGYGIFWGDTYAGGKYAELIGDIQGSPLDGTLIDYVDNAYNTIATRGNRAIAGYGVGGYGAMRVAVEYDENYSAVTSISAPLDFDGSLGSAVGNGFLDYFDVIINGIGNDTSVTYRTLDTSSFYPRRNMMIAASTAFSPHYIYENIVSYDLEPVAEDTLLFFPDSTSLINPGERVNYHLPFDSTGSVVDTVWSVWMNNNVANILQNDPGALDSTDISLMVFSGEQFGFTQQTRNFSVYLEGHLESRGISADLVPTVHYGYDGYDADLGRFIYDVLPDILKYHSSKFEVNQ